MVKNNTDKRKVLVQIYEVQQPAEAEKLVEMGVDHIGSVVLAEEQWKVPALKDTVRVVAEGGARSSLIPLFSSADTISRVIDYYRPDMAHFCEVLSSRPEDAVQMEEICRVQQVIRDRFPEIAIMRSIPVAPAHENIKTGPEELPEVLKQTSDFFLTDTLLTAKAQYKEGQPVSGFVGITGQPCDWEAVAALTASSAVPVFLAGGIADDNVYDGIIKTRPAGVDSCTRTNARDGRGGYVRFQKDLARVARLVSEVRRAEEVLNG